MQVWKKRICLLLIAVMLLVAACGYSDRSEDPETGYRVIIASDIHYLSPELTDYGALFQSVMEAGDGKLTEYCDEITDAFLAETAALHPDALILTGDLSFNGERKSHEALAEKLKELEDAGVAVLVLPGNHDLYRGGAYAFFGEVAEQVPSVTAEEFREIYRNFGFDAALSEDEDSLSYMAQLNEWTRVLMLDANTLHNYCGFSLKTLTWIEEQLREAGEAGQTVLAACHQNLYQHSLFSVGYVLNQAEKLQTILENGQVPLILSGHMHIQHIRREGAVTEIASSALTMGACQYGLLEKHGEMLRYETRPVNVDAWAEQNAAADRIPADFGAYARFVMEEHTREEAEHILTARGFSEEGIQAMSRYACALNTAYFYGDLSEAADWDADGSLMAAWQETGSFLGNYLASIEKEIGCDHTHWTNEA